MKFILLILLICISPTFANENCEYSISNNLKNNQNFTTKKRKNIIMEHKNNEFFPNKMKKIYEEEKYKIEEDPWLLDFCTKELKLLEQHNGKLNEVDIEYLAEEHYLLATTIPPKKALEHINKAIELDNTRAEYYFLRGRIKESLSEWQEALNDYSTSIAIMPSEEAYAYRGSIYFRFNKLNNAIEDFTNSIATCNYTGYLKRGCAKYYLGDINGAIKDFDEYSSLVPNEFYVYGYRGDAKIKLNDFNGALADFRKFLELEPNNINAKKAFLNLKINLAEEGSIKTIAFTKKDGTKVQQFITDEGIIELPLEE